jgi:glycosyltransferase involved in cell wall biosynthesis
MRLALITNIPSPYRLPVWQALAGKMESMRVFFCSETEPNRIWKPEAGGEFRFSQTHLPGAHFFIQKMDWGLHFNPGLWKELDRYQPDHLLISGYETPSYLLALLYAKLKKIPITLWWASHGMSSRVQGGPIVRLKRWILNQFDSFCAVSHPAQEYLVTVMRVPAEKIARAINTVDVVRWHAEVQKHSEARQVQAGEPVRFLCIGQFIPRKGILELLGAFKSISVTAAILRLIGYGPQETEIRAFIRQHHMNNVEIAGATQTLEQTALHYAWAEVLVMPSLIEVWGLVVNEALAGGVYVLASKFAGVTHDLIEQAPYDVGLSFDPTQKQAVVAALQSVIEKRRSLDRKALSAWGLRHTPEAYAEGLWKALRLVECPAGDSA